MAVQSQRELPLLAVLRPSVADPKPKYTTDRYQKGGLMPIRIKTRDTWSHCHNSLNKRRLWRIVHES
jgi:hypothetical protein